MTNFYSIITDFDEVISY